MRILPPPNTHIKIVAILSDITFIRLIIFWFHFSEKTKLEGEFVNISPGDCCHYPATLPGGYKRLSPTKQEGKQKSSTPAIPTKQIFQLFFFSFYM